MVVLRLASGWEDDLSGTPHFLSLLNFILFEPTVLVKNRFALGLAHPQKK